jgi:hypothetical protein
MVLQDATIFVPFMKLSSEVVPSECGEVVMGQLESSLEVADSLVDQVHRPSTKLECAGQGH